MDVTGKFITNFDGILYHSARVYKRKQKTLKILGFVICVEDYHKETQFLIRSPLGNLTVRVYI
jgi:hypothetical protein